MTVTERLGLSVLTVKHIGQVADDGGGFRPAYKVVIMTPRWQYVDTDLHGGVGEKPNERTAFGSLVSFLLACVESQPDGENADLFPKHVAEWADSHESALTELSLDYTRRTADEN
jgi:hypothetical protein